MTNNEINEEMKERSIGHGPKRSQAAYARFHNGEDSENWIEEDWKVELIDSILKKEEEV